MLAGLLGVRRDGLGVVADLAGDGRDDARETDADGSGVLRGGAEAAGSEPRPRT
jgi:hypothetical protein